MNKLDWTKFSKRIGINSRREVMFESWTTQQNLERWFLSEASFFGSDKKVKDRNASIGVGDTYRWMWHGSDNVAEGEILDVSDSNSLKFTFLGCIVSVEFKIEEGEELIELIQSEIPLDEQSRMSYYVGCSRGWTFYLTNLKSILEGGIDLRNKKGSLMNVINT